ncbi:hypothetical protein QNI16_31975 [Cytophagaceae bacterium YF14B1]|uniref:HTH luxR-type domain-containing protein n=1 Tax=Xanthocytophaga flava TaxID=3048013 RepID=A0AAE3UA53_9BACT|nr:hypothetical protein [Xanthocytophaga flavus]MDJ1485161.1 hypothetical protein [Xanthocytophaga flavus]
MTAAKQFISKQALFLGVVIIIMLLLLNIVFTYRNNRIMQENRQLQKQAEEIKVAVSQAIYIIHNADLALRGYALFKDTRYLPPLYFANEDKDSIYLTIEQPLRKQNYPLTEFYQLKDSINAYVHLCMDMKVLFDQKNYSEFERLANLDKGYHLWLQYERFMRTIHGYEDTINLNSQRRYDEAEKRIYLVQFLLLLLCVPTLLFTAFHTHKRLITAERLKEVREENARLLAEQNMTLEKVVVERTAEIARQNKELKEKHQQIIVQNITLRETQRQKLEIYTQTILEKNQIIETIQYELEELKNNRSESEGSVDTEIVEKIKVILQSRILTEESWQQFRTDFESVYPLFFATLHYHYSDITQAELRLSALIKLNLSLKESATILGIAPESVKKARHRLRKKLQVEEEETLEKFIQTLA